MHLLLVLAALARGTPAQRAAATRTLAALPDHQRQALLAAASTLDDLTG